MGIYKDKYCGVCGKIFSPTSSNQKYCVTCKDEGRKIVDRVRDRNRSRKRNAYKEYTRKCLYCGVEFKTYYKKKIYCGAEDCDKYRISKKNKISQSRRNAESESKRYRDYYNRNKELCRYRKALKQRELNIELGEYEPRGFFKHTIQHVREYVNRFGYKLLSNEYVNNRSKIVLRCPEGHEWETTFHNFRNNGGNKGNRCLYCYLENNYTSRPEQKVLDYFLDNYPDMVIIHNDRKQISPLEIDIYFPNSKLGVEVCGLYWHSEISGGKNNKYHYNKMMRCLDKDIRLITVFEDEIRDKFEIVISRILTAIGLLNTRVYARKCLLEELSVGEANSFFENNHIQGRSVAKKSWGLFYEGELVAACSVGATGRKHAGGVGVVELKRFCSKLNYSVVGGFSKLFKAVIFYCVSNKYSTLKSYCDMRYANIFNPIYEKVGFGLGGFTKYTPHYIKNGKRYRNMSLRKTPEERMTGKTEFELRIAQGYDRIWDCGHRTYVYEVTA